MYFYLQHIVGPIIKYFYACDGLSVYLGDLSHISNQSTSKTHAINERETLLYKSKATKK